MPLDDPAQPKKKPNEIMMDFRRAVESGDFDAAHRMLTPKLRAELPPERLKTEYVSMYGYVEGETAADHVEVMNVMEDWLAKEPQDIGWAYVSINGPDPAGGTWSEAVAVVVTDVDGHLLIREIEWGRP